MPRDPELFEKRMLQTGFGALIGTRLEHVEDGYCRVRLPYKDSLSRGDELVHGGVISALIDNAGTAAAWSYDDIVATARGATVALTVNFLQGAKQCDLIAHARVLRRGGSITVIDVEVKNPDGDIIATGPVTYKLTNR